MESKQDPDLLSGNVFRNIPEGVFPDELFDVLFQKGDVRMERIVSTGQCSPEGFWYDQPEDEWVMVLQGEGELFFEDGRRMVLRAGDYCFLPSGCRHRVERTSQCPPCIWLAVFLARNV